MRRGVGTRFVAAGKHSSRRTHLRVMFVVAVVLVGTSAGAAYGYMTSTGQAAGSVTTGSLVAVTLTTTGTPSSTLIPGGTADVVLGVHNPNAFSVTLVSVIGGPGSITADSGHPACTTTGVTFADQTGLDIVVAPSGTTTVHLANAASMGESSSTGCQGATFNIPVTITVHQG